MKYPWTALSLIIVWLATTFMILRVPAESVDINFILIVTIIGTVIISLIGFRAPKIKK